MFREYIQYSAFTGGIPVLRGYGPGEEPCDPGARGPLPAPQRRWRRGDAGADRRVLHAEPPGLVRRCRERDHVQVGAVFLSLCIFILFSFYMCFSRPEAAIQDIIKKEKGKMRRV